MSSFEKALARIGRDLDRLGHPWALVGALAVAARAEARATLDVDVAIAVDGREGARGVVESLRAVGYRWQRDLGTFMSSFLVPEGPEAGLRLDVLFSLSGLEAQVADRAERIAVLPGIELPVALTGDLIALKLLAAGEPGREHDWRDLRALLKRSVPADRELARSGIAVLAREEPEKGRELTARLEKLLAAH